MLSEAWPFCLAAWLVDRVSAPCHGNISWEAASIPCWLGLPRPHGLPPGSVGRHGYHPLHRPRFLGGEKYCFEGASLPPSWERTLASFLRFPEAAPSCEWEGAGAASNPTSLPAGDADNVEQTSLLLLLEPTSSPGLLF